MKVETATVARIGKHALVWLFALWLIGCAAQQPPPKKAAEATVPTPEVKMITGISVTEDTRGVHVQITGTQLLTYTSVKQPYPLGVLMYFPETVLKNVSPLIAGGHSVVKEIKVSEITTKGHTARIEIALKKDLPYEVARQGHGLNVSFTTASVSDDLMASQEQAPSAAAALAEAIDDQATVADEVDPAIETKAEESAALTVEPAAAPEAEIEQAPVAQAQPAAPEAPAWVNRVDFSSAENGESTIIIGTTRPVDYKLQKAADKQLTLSLLNTRIPVYRQKPLLTNRFKSAVDRIVPIQSPSQPDTSTVAIELRESVPYFIEQNENLLLIQFEVSTIPPRPVEAPQMPSPQQVAQESDDASVVTLAATSVPETQPVVKTPAPVVVGGGMNAAEQDDIERPPVYSGEKIALDFYETDIKNVFRILREVSGKNFAIDKDVSGKVTLTFEKPVPWDQVLDLILKMNQLGKVTEGEIIRIATLATLKREDDLQREKIVARQKAKEQKKKVEPLTTEYISINYSNARTEILPHLNEIVTKDRGSLSVDERTNVIIMTDTQEKIHKAREIVQQLDRVVDLKYIWNEADFDFVAPTGSAKDDIDLNTFIAGIGFKYLF